MSVYGRLLWITAVWSFGANLVFFFLNFHLEALGFSRWGIGLAQALLTGIGVVLAFPLAHLVPQLGYLHSLYLGLGFYLLGLLAVGLGVGVYPGLLFMGAAGLLVQGVAPALAASLLPEGQRVGFYSLQAALSTATGFMASLLAGLLSDWMGPRFVLLWAWPFFLLSWPLVRGLPEARGRARPLGPIRFGLWLRYLLPQLLVAFGAGLVIPFLNLYLRAKFGLSYGAVGLLFALSSLATALAMLLQPWLVARLGKVRAIVLVQALSLPFLAALAWAHWLPLVAIALLVRGALMNAATPVYTALITERLPEGEWSGFLILEGALWSLLWALASLLSGSLQEAWGLAAFHFLFATTLLLYALGIALWPWAFREKA